MHVCVLGGGVVGVTTAYFLAREGHRVTVVEQHPEAGVETSFANGGQLSYSYVAPLAGPSALHHLPAWLLSKTAPLFFRPSLSLSQWTWCMQFLRHCTTDRSRQTTVEMLLLGAYSKAVMNDVMQDEGIDFDHSKSGKLVVYRDPVEFEGAKRQMDFQAKFGAEQSALDAKACVLAEPALSAVGERLAGGILTPSEDAGDCYLFTRELGRVAKEKYDVKFLFNNRVHGLVREHGKVVAVRIDSGELIADSYVLALGNGSSELAADVGIRLPMYPLKGYSLTVPVGPTHRAPSMSVTDLHHKIVYAKLGQHLRVAGMVDMTPPGSKVDAARIELLRLQAAATMPNAGDFPDAQVWTGARPATPDSKPLLGKTNVSNLLLNTGHGALGFTLACASAKLVADTLCGRSSALDLAPYQLAGRNVRRDYRKLGSPNLALN